MLKKQLSIDTSDLDFELNAPPISDDQPSSRAGGQDDFNDIEYDFSQMSMTELMRAIGPGEDTIVSDNRSEDESIKVNELIRATNPQIITNQVTSRTPSRASLAQGSDYN